MLERGVGALSQEGGHYAHVEACRVVAVHRQSAQGVGAEVGNLGCFAGLRQALPPEGSQGVRRDVRRGPSLLRRALFRAPTIQDHRREKHYAVGPRRTDSVRPAHSLLGGPRVGSRVFRGRLS